MIRPRLLIAAAISALIPALAGAAEPPPSPADLAAAEADVREVFGAQIAAARKPADRVAVARRLIDTAAGSRPAARYALLIRARDLAASARDSAVAVEAVAALVAGFAAQQPQQPAEAAAEGHRLWNLAADRRPPDRLTTQLDAAACYLRALPSLTGFERAAAESRLRALGWKRSPIDFTFSESTEGWAVEKHIADLKWEAGCLTGQIIGGDPCLIRPGLKVNAPSCPVLEVCLSITKGNLAQFYWVAVDSPRWGEDKCINFPIRADGQFHVYRLDLAKAKTWAGTITAIRLDPAEWDHRSKQSAAFSVDFLCSRRVEDSQ